MLQLHKFAEITQCWIWNMWKIHWIDPFLVLYGIQFERNNRYQKKTSSVNCFAMPFPISHNKNAYHILQMEMIWPEVSTIPEWQINFNFIENLLKIMCHNVVDCPHWIWSSNMLKMVNANILKCHFSSFPIFMKAKNKHDDNIFYHRWLSKMVLIQLNMVKWTRSYSYPFCNVQLR